MLQSNSIKVILPVQSPFTDEMPVTVWLSRAARSTRGWRGLGCGNDALTQLPESLVWVKQCSRVTCSRCVDPQDMRQALCSLMRPMLRCFILIMCRFGDVDFHQRPFYPVDLKPFASVSLPPHRIPRSRVCCVQRFLWPWLVAVTGCHWSAICQLAHCQGGDFSFRVSRTVFVLPCNTSA